MDAHAARAKLGTVEHQIVALGAHFPRRGFELVEIFFDNAREGMLRADPLFICLAPFEKRKTGEPKQLPAVFRDEAEFFSEEEPQLSGYQRGGFGAFDLLASGGRDNHVAGFCPRCFDQFFYAFGAKCFFQWRGIAFVGDFHGVHAARAGSFAALGHFVELLAAPCGGTGSDQAEDRAFEAKCGACGLEVRGEVGQFHAESQIGLVAAVTADGVLIKHVAEGPRDLDADHSEGRLHGALDDVEDVLGTHERHLQIELREFRLAVGAKIFVAETAHDLEIAVEAANHQNLLEDLRRLRQRIELAGIDAAGHQIIARALRSRAREHGRFDFVETERVEGLPDFEDHLVAQLQVAMLARTPQVQVAVAQARLFGGGGVVFHHEWRRFGGVQDVQARGQNFYLAGGQVRIGLFAADDFAFDGGDKFRAKLFGLSVSFGRGVAVEDNLREAGAVPKIDEDHLAVVAAAMHPAHEHDVRAGIGGAEIAAAMRAFQITEKI